MKFIKFTQTCEIHLIPEISIVDFFKFIYMDFFVVKCIICLYKGKERLAETLNVSADQAKSFTTSFLGMCPYRMVIS